MVNEPDIAPFARRVPHSFSSPKIRRNH